MGLGVGAALRVPAPGGVGARPCAPSPATPHPPARSSPPGGGASSSSSSAIRGAGPVVAMAGRTDRRPEAPGSGAAQTRRPERPGVSSPRPSRSGNPAGRGGDEGGRSGRPSQATSGVCSRSPELPPLPCIFTPTPSAGRRGAPGPPRATGAPTRRYGSPDAAPLQPLRVFVGTQRHPRTRPALWTVPRARVGSL